MRGSLEGGVVVASDWCWSISCSTAAALTRKAGGRPLSRRRAPRSQSRKTPRSATTLPKPRRQVVVEPLLPCAKTYIRATARSRRKASRQDYFTGTEVVAWSRQPRNHACGNARRWEKLYHQTLTNAFLKKLHRDCQCLDFCP